MRSDSGCGAQIQQMLGIAMGELCDIVRTEDLRQAVEKCPTAHVGAVWVIDGEKKAINADHLNGAAQGRQGEIAAGGAVNVGLEVVGDGLVKIRRGMREDAAGAGQRIGQTLPHVAEDELQRGQAIKEAGNDEAQGMKAGLGVPTQPAMERRKPSWPGRPE